ncbi:hypothetical protein HON22_05900 [Candidatus Peregrinibacteria bacterium]|jgi:pimeloyl-ACP methyl ester carboxylesterase|nr:hypothetical protein [Candidatus Peregrinibacteria bacterium]
MKKKTLNPKVSFRIFKHYMWEAFRNPFSFPKKYKTLCNSLFKEYDVLKNIKVPTKIIWGKYDEIFPLEMAKAMQKEIHNSELILIEGNHDWAVFKPQEFFEIIYS